jgi:isopenicillin-N N-acyltransferase-like protein
MFVGNRLRCLLFGLALAIQITSGHKTGSFRNLGAFCHNDTSHGTPNLIPIDESPARLVNKVENGTLYQIGAGEDQVWLVHVYGNSGYDFGFAYGTLLRDQIHQVLPRAWAHFEQQVMEAFKDLKLPKWFEELIADKGLALALDVQNELVSKYMDEEVYNEMRGLSDAAQVDYKMVVRLHMLGEITRGKLLFPRIALLVR